MKKYEVYKDSGLDWLGKIPEHWKVVPLKSFIIINHEVLPETTASDFDIHYIDIGNVNERGIIAEPEKVKFGQAPSRARRVVKQGDTIISTVRTYLKAIAFIQEDSSNLIASTGFGVLSPKIDVAPKYVSYLVQNHTFISQISANSYGVNYPAITPGQLGTLKIAITRDQREQNAIVAFLDHKLAEIDRFIANKQRMIALLKEQKAAIINRAVTRGIEPGVQMKPSGIEWLGEIPAHWTMAKLRSMCVSVRDGTHAPPAAVKGIHRLLSARNIVNGKFVLRDDDRTLTPEDFTLLEKSYTIRQGDVVVAIVGATTGKSAIVDEIQNVSAQRSIAILRPHTHRLLSDFLNYWLMSAFVQNRIQMIMEQYAAQPGIYLEDVAALKIPVISTDEQKSIISQIKSETAVVNSAIHRTEREIELIKEYRTVLISEAVTGKIDVRVASKVEIELPV